MTRRLFITATGTDIGKTFVMLRLIRELKAGGHTVRALKPVMSGYEEGEEDDASLLGAECLYRLKAPLSPDMAARAEGIILDYRRIVEFCNQPCTEDFLLIEGAGGVMSPVAERHTVLDLIADSTCQALLVAGSYLGTVSHTLTALKMLEAKHVPVCGIVLSESEGKGHPPMQETITTLKNFAASPIMPLPRGSASAALITRELGISG